MLLDPTPSRLKLLQAGKQYNSSRGCTFLPVDAVNYVGTLQGDPNLPFLWSSYCDLFQLHPPGRKPTPAPSHPPTAAGAIVNTSRTAARTAAVGAGAGVRVGSSAHVGAGVGVGAEFRVDVGVGIGVDVRAGDVHTTPPCQWSVPVCTTIPDAHTEMHVGMLGDGRCGALPSLAAKPP
jgi:hypothetical protein